MAEFFTWSVEKLKTIPLFNEKEDVVRSVCWRLNADFDSRHVSVYGEQPIPFSETELFTPFSELSEGTVLSWLSASLGEERISSLKKELSDLAESQPVRVPPWATA